MDASCSGQWSLSASLRLNAPLAQSSGVIWNLDGGYPAPSIGRGKASWRALWLHWGGSYVRKVDLSDATLRQLHLVVTRDGGRLGLFVNGAWGWAMPDLDLHPPPGMPSPTATMRRCRQSFNRPAQSGELLSQVRCAGLVDTSVLQVNQSH